MARRVAWTNNSSGHSGTYVYRAPTLDPQNLPAPVATVDPVAQGATAEWNDTETLAAGDYDYAVQDFDEGGTGVLSAIVTHTIAEDLSTAQVGDYIAGGVYAGTLTYADEITFHLIMAEQSGEAASMQWGNHGSATGATDDDDGLANQNLVLTNFDDGSADAFYHCRDYAGGGYTDWYLPARNELSLSGNLVDSNHPEFSSFVSVYRYTSTEISDTGVVGIIFSTQFNGLKTKTDKIRVRPVRRVAA